MKTCYSKVKSKELGFALVLVLWIISLLTVMAGSFALTMRRESVIVAGSKDNASAAAAAEAGIAVAEMMLLNPDKTKRWRADSNIYEVDFGDTEVRVRLISESGKIDINKADMTLLRSVLEKSPLEERQQVKLAAAIVDWRDKDDLVSLEGAEKEAYKSAGLKYQPRNKPFQTMEELQMVLGMNETIFNWLEPLVTIYSGQGQVNLNLAPLNVLKVLPNLDASMIETYARTRLESAKTNQPTPEFPASLGKGGGGAGAETVTIVSEARLPDATGAVVLATVTKQGNNTAGMPGVGTEPYRVLQWERNPLNVEPLFNEVADELVVNRYAEPELSN